MRSISLPEFVKECGSIQKTSFALEIPYASIWNWIHGKSKPSRAMARLLKMKGINLDYSIVIDKPMAPGVVDNPRNV